MIASKLGTQALLSSVGGRNDRITEEKNRIQLETLKVGENKEPLKNYYKKQIKAKAENSEIIKELKLIELSKKQKEEIQITEIRT